MSFTNTKSIRAKERRYSETVYRIDLYRTRKIALLTWSEKILASCSVQPNERTWLMTSSTVHFMIRCLSLEATESFSKLMAALSSLRPIMENWLPSGHGKEKGVTCCTALSASVETKTMAWRRRSPNLSHNLSRNLIYGWRSSPKERKGQVLYWSKKLRGVLLLAAQDGMPHSPLVFCQVAPNITPLSILFPGGDKHHFYLTKNTACNDQYDILDLKLDTRASLFPHES